MPVAQTEVPFGARGMAKKNDKKGAAKEDAGERVEAFDNTKFLEKMTGTINHLKVGGISQMCLIYSSRGTHHISLLAFFSLLFTLCVLISAFISIIGEFVTLTYPLSPLLCLSLYGAIG